MCHRVRDCDRRPLPFRTTGSSMQVLHKLKMSWYLSGSSFLWWKLHKEMLLADRKAQINQEKLLQMLQGMDPPCYDEISTDTGAYSISHDLQTSPGVFRWGKFIFLLCADVPMLLSE